MRESGGIVWLPRQALSDMEAEADRVNPLETGGVLLGYWGRPAVEAVVTHVTGPGPRAIHLREAFEPDDDFQSEEIARIYGASGRLFSYLGDWHTHPGATAYLSPTDRKTLRKIARHGPSRLSVPLMAVLAGGDPWHLRIWRYKPPRWNLRFPRALVCPLSVQLYDDLGP
jgi:integrative and conjugative element protein (TIGR02256 family)